jgi:hypothetical protein
VMALGRDGKAQVWMGNLRHHYSHVGETESGDASDELHDFMRKELRSLRTSSHANIGF